MQVLHSKLYLSEVKVSNSNRIMRIHHVEWSLSVFGHNIGLLIFLGSSIDQFLITDRAFCL